MSPAADHLKYEKINSCFKFKMVVFWWYLGLKAKKDFPSKDVNP